VFLEKQYRFINFPLRSLRLCEKTVRYTFNVGWFSAITKIDKNYQIKPELLSQINLYQ